MTDDIVTRLREKYSGQLPICAEAADEIERLRAELLESQKDLGLLRRARDRRDDEIERLRQLTSELAQLMMPFAMLMTTEEQEKVMKVVRNG